MGVHVAAPRAVLAGPRAGLARGRDRPLRRPLGRELGGGADRQRVAVDPATGRVRLRVRTAGRSIELDPRHARARERAGASGDLTSLALVDLRTGARRPLRWPSRLHFGFQVFPAPHGPLVALRFGEPWYPPSQAADVWVLNTSTGSLTEVPGFPALELLKFSTIAWTADDRLVVASTGPRRTVVGVWRPGQRTMALRTVPRAARLHRRSCRSPRDAPRRPADGASARGRDRRRPPAADAPSPRRRCARDPRPGGVRAHRRFALPGDAVIASASSPRPLSGTPLTGRHARAPARRGRRRLPPAGSVSSTSTRGRSAPITMPGGAPLVAWLEPFGGAALASGRLRGLHRPGGAVRRRLRRLGARPRRCRRPRAGAPGGGVRREAGR